MLFFGLLFIYVELDLSFNKTSEDFELPRFTLKLNQKMGKLIVKLSVYATCRYDIAGVSLALKPCRQVRHRVQLLQLVLMSIPHPFSLLITNKGNSSYEPL